MEKDHKSQSDPVLQSRLFEAKRIENYLRSEVSDLWEYINTITKLPFFKIFVKVSTKIQKFNRIRDAVLVNNKDLDEEIMEFNKYFRKIK